MKVTFGKWQGWDTDDLAKTTEGRSYLEWGKEKLQSPMWRNEFARALREAAPMDETLEIRAISKANPDIDEVEAWQIVQERKKEAALYAAQEEALEEARTKVVAKYAALAGIDAQAMRNALGQVENYVLRFDEMPPASRFSSPERAAMMEQAYEEWEKCYEVMGW